MVNWTQITGFDWDEGNARNREEKHAVIQSETERAFFSQPLLILSDKKHSQNEERYDALGKTDDARLLHITFAARHGERSEGE